jgi:hypothetical protein
MKTFMIDPPSGWQHGFPKPVPQEILESQEKLTNWFVEQGYPKQDIPLAVRYSRYWEIDES